MASAVTPYLDKALRKLSEIGLLPAEQSPLPVMGTLGKIESLDPDRVMALARTLQKEGDFNAIVRDNIKAISVADRYQDIAAAFESIREDAKMLCQQMEKPQLSFSDKARRAWMRTRRGTVAERFDKIKSIYLDVAQGSRVAIEREHVILEAYGDFRLALKQGEVNAHTLHEMAAEKLEQAKAAYATASAAVEQRGETADAPTRDSDIARLQLQRDSVKRELDQARRIEQIAKDMADNLKISYHTGESVMARLAQTTQVKERVYEQAITFFTTNENVFTALSASVTSLQGLKESTQTINALKAGVNRSIEDLAETGNASLMEGVKAGYGPTISAESVKKLIDAIVEYEKDTHEVTREMRQLATDNAEQIATYVEEGKRRYAALVMQSEAS